MDAERAALDRSGQGVVIPMNIDTVGEERIVWVEERRIEEERIGVGREGSIQLAEVRELTEGSIE